MAKRISRRARIAPEHPEEQTGFLRLKMKYGFSWRDVSVEAGYSPALLIDLARYGKFPARAKKTEPALNAFKKKIGNALLAVGVSEDDVANVLWSNGTRVLYEVVMKIHIDDHLTPEVRKHFRLTEDPFTSARLPQSADDVFLTDAAESVVAGIVEKLDAGIPVALFGPTGTGKSWIREEVQRRVTEASTDNRLILPRRVNRRRLMETDIVESIVLDVTPREKIRASGERRTRQARDAVQAVADAGGRIILVIDEAHLLSTQALVLLKNFAEMTDGYHRALSIFMVGQPSLANDLRGDPTLQEVRMRVNIVEAPGLAAKSSPRARGFDDLAIGRYLAHKLRAFGGEVAVKRIFDESAIDTLRKTPECRRPMYLNRLVSVAMNLAWYLGEDRVTGETVAHAIKNL